MLRTTGNKRLQGTILLEDICTETFQISRQGLNSGSRGIIAAMLFTHDGLLTVCTTDLNEPWQGQALNSRMHELIEITLPIERYFEFVKLLER